MKQENPSAYEASKPRLTTQVQTKTSRDWVLRSALSAKRGLALAAKSGGRTGDELSTRSWWPQRRKPVHRLGMSRKRAGQQVETPSERLDPAQGTELNLRGKQRLDRKKNWQRNWLQGKENNDLSTWTKVNSEQGAVSTRQPKIHSRTK
jgi:hypothetical protein